MRMAGQKGSTLIVILIIVMLIMMIGAVVIRQGLVSLNVATASQAQNLMIQNSDAAIYAVENANNANLNQALALNGMIGYINIAANRGKELVFCYRGQEKDLFDLSRASLVEWSGSATNRPIGETGFCTVGDTKSFVSGRNAMLTQISIMIPAETTSSTPFQSMSLGTDTASAKTLSAKQVIVYAVSIIPTLSRASDTTINNCLKNHMHVAPATGEKTVSECLTEAHVPFITHVSEYSLSQNVCSGSQNTKCKK